MVDDGGNLSESNCCQNSLASPGKVTRPSVRNAHFDDVADVDASYENVVITGFSHNLSLGTPLA